MSMFFLATQINYLEKESKIFNRVVFIAWSIIPVPNSPFIHQLLKPFRTSSAHVIYLKVGSRWCLNTVVGKTLGRLIVTLVDQFAVVEQFAKQYEKFEFLNQIWDQPLRIKHLKLSKKAFQCYFWVHVYLWYKIFIQNQTRCMLLEVQKWHWIDSLEENPYLKQFWHSYFRLSWRSFISLPRKISIIWRCSTQLAVACFNETFLTLNFNRMILTFFKKSHQALLHRAQW